MSKNPDRAIVRRAAGLVVEAPVGARAVVDGWCDLAPNEFRWWIGLSMLPRATLRKGFGAIGRALDTPHKTAFRLTVALEIAGFVSIGDGKPPKGQRPVTMMREPWWAGVGRFHSVSLGTAERRKSEPLTSRVTAAPSMPGVLSSVDGSLFGKRVIVKPP